MATEGFIIEEEIEVEGLENGIIEDGKGEE